MKLTALALVAVAVAGAGAARLIQSARTGLLAQRAAVASAWDRVDHALQPRGPQIARLVEMMKEAAPREEDLLTGAAQAGVSLVSARGPQGRIDANSALDAATGRLLVKAESYPKLLSSPKFQHLMEELRDTEARIAVERRKYNEVLQRYNIAIEQFPNNLAAWLFGFSRDDAYFLAAPAAPRHSGAARDSGPSAARDSGPSAARDSGKVRF